MQNVAPFVGLTAVAPHVALVATLVVALVALTVAVVGMVAAFVSGRLALRGRVAWRRAGALGVIDLENVGFGLAVFGGILALVVVLLIIWAPTAIPLIDNEVIALIGLILVVAGVLVHLAD